MRSLPRKRLFIGGLVAVSALAFLMYQGFQSFAFYYYSVEEIQAKQESLVSEQVRVNGLVMGDSIQRDQKNLVLSFNLRSLEREDKYIPVVYNGVVPDIFQADVQMVVEGQLTTEGVFEASTLVFKCPSRYEPELVG